MKRFVDVDGKEIALPTDQEIAEIIERAEHTLHQDMCIDHPCEFGWAEDVLKLATWMFALKEHQD